MKKFFATLLGLAIVLSAHTASAWGGFGHGSIAYMAEQHLTPEAKAKCNYYLKHSLPYYASWMDSWRAVPPYNKSGAHSFRANADGTVDWEGGNGRVIGNVNRIYNSMKDGKYKKMPDSLVNINLKILVHAVPDMHCPVHVGFPKKEYPHYKYSLLRRGKKLSYHTFWDGSPGFARKGWDYERYRKEVDNATPKQIKKIIKKGNINAWGEDIIRQAHRSYRITPVDTETTKMSAEQKAEVWALADEMALKGAHRLAYILNEIFKE